MPTLSLGVIGNCAISALIDPAARVVWCCLPRPDGDPVFHALIDGEPREGQRGVWAIELDGYVRSEQQYVENTTVLLTRLFDGAGNAIEITDFAPRFEARERMYRPMMLVRRLRPLAGTPRIRIRLRPSHAYGKSSPDRTQGSNHIRYVGAEPTLRLTSNAPISYLMEETSFLLDEPLSLLLGPDEPLSEGIEATARAFEENTTRYWKEWVRRLTLPLEWQEAVIRAALTLKLCTFEETGAILAAITTSIPEHHGSSRNWDYRYCWLRDAFFVVRALNSLSEVDTMERYLRYLANLVTGAAEGHLQPVYGIGLERHLYEREAGNLAGYRGMGPVRIGNQAYEHFQHDVYGNVVLASAQAFFDLRLLRRGTLADFERLEQVGEQAYRVYTLPDAGMWELRTRARVHTSSVLMCWAACDRLAKIATHLHLANQARRWQERADEIREAIETKAWNAKLNSYAESFGGEDVEAGLLLMAEVGYSPPGDVRFQSTVEAIERRLKRGHHLFRYVAADDFGVPQTAFNICTFWHIDALIRTGRKDEARELFEHTLTWRNRLGLLSEDIDPKTHELWGNDPQTYSLVGIINAATRLSRRWEELI